MRITFNKIAFAASLALALPSILSCSSDDDKGGEEKYAYCVFMEQQTCLSGSFASCQNGGNLSQTCPFNATGLSSSTGGGGSSSSVGSGSFTDKGNNISNYATKVIGTQTWMTENLDYNVEGSKCYNDEPENCNKYGRLYNWVTAMDLPSSCNSSSCASQIRPNHQGICPAGWHIPSEAEWESLLCFVNGSTSTDCPYDKPTVGKDLKAISGWNNGGNGTDAHGFAALPGGHGNSLGEFGNVGDRGYWLSASEYLPNAYGFIKVIRLNYNRDNAGWDNSTKSLLYSVRCIKD